MRVRHFDSLILLAGWFLAGSVLVPSTLAFAAAPEAPPHIIVLLADDLGWGDVGFHGSQIRTPHLDALAARGMQLDQFYVQPVCSPTRGALLTGRYPLRFGLQCGVVRPWADYGLPTNERTLPQLLRDVGYTTAIIGKWHLGHARRTYLPLSRGFDVQYGHYNGMLDYVTHQRDGGHDWHRQDQAAYDEGYTTNLIADEAVRQIGTHDPANPLFLYVPFNAPHTPLQAPEEYLQQYANMPNPARRAYAAMVTCMDDAVGRITAALGEHLPNERTLIFFCSDNGGVVKYGSNGSLRDGKGTLYEGGIRVPAVMVWDGTLPAGSTVSEPLHIVDLLPTFAGLAGARHDLGKPLDGHDVWPVLTNGQRRANSEIIHNVSPFHAAIRSGDWKLIENGHVGANVLRSTGKRQWELFDIRRDPNEKRDLSAAHRDVVSRLKTRIKTLRQEMTPPQIAPNRPPPEFVVPKVWGEPAAERTLD